MNAAAAQALYEAERNGVRQIKGEYSDIAGGLCAMGVLIMAAGVNALHLTFGRGGMGLCHERDVTCPCCGKRHELEADLIVHLNDDHGLKFGEIARKLGPDSA